MAIREEIEVAEDKSSKSTSSDITGTLNETAKKKKPISDTSCTRINRSENIIEGTSKAITPAAILHQLENNVDDNNLVSDASNKSCNTKINCYTTHDHHQYTSQQQHHQESQHHSHDYYHESTSSSSSLYPNFKPYAEHRAEGMIPLEVLSFLDSCAQYVVDGDPRPQPDCCWCGPNWITAITTYQQRQSSICVACTSLKNIGWKMDHYSRYISPTNDKICSSVPIFMHDTTWFVAEEMKKMVHNNISDSHSISGVVTHRNGNSYTSKLLPSMMRPYFRGNHKIPARSRQTCASFVGGRNPVTKCLPPKSLGKSESFVSYCSELTSSSVSSYCTSNSTLSDESGNVHHPWFHQSLPHSITLVPCQPCHIGPSRSTNDHCVSRSNNRRKKCLTQHTIKSEQTQRRDDVNSSNRDMKVVNIDNENSRSSKSTNERIYPSYCKEVHCTGKAFVQDKKPKYKTEPCKFFSNDKHCPFGNECHFAHGIHELQCKTLFELHDLGIVDAEKFRTRPCFDWVSTGSCPYNERCNNIHDPRIASEKEAWLRKIERPNHKCMTNVHIDNHHHSRLNELHQNSPIKENNLFMTPMQLDENSLCNKNNKYIIKPRIISEQRFLEITSKMRPKFGYMYVHNPAHKINGHPCTLLNIRAFKIPPKECELISEIPVEEYYAHRNRHKKQQDFPGQFTSRNKQSATFLAKPTMTCTSNRTMMLQTAHTKGVIPHYVIVHELAFCSYGHHANSVALYFNLPSDALEQCSFQEIKILTQKSKTLPRPLLIKTPLSSSVISNRKGEIVNKTINEEQKHNEEENLYESSRQIYHNDCNLYCLDRKINEHRLRVIISSRNNNTNHDKHTFHSSETHDKWLSSSPTFSMLTTVLAPSHVDNLRLEVGNASAKITERNVSILKVEEMILEAEHSNVCDHLSSRNWPINKGRDGATKYTPTPNVISEYNIESDTSSSSKFWKSFLSTNQCDKLRNIKHHCHDKNYHRLPIFGSFTITTTTELAANNSEENCVSLPYVENNLKFWTAVYHHWDIVKTYHKEAKENEKRKLQKTNKKTLQKQKLF